MDNYEFKLITPNNANNSAKGKGKQKASLVCLRKTNWNFDEVMDLISCKQKQKIALKQIIDPRANMVPILGNGARLQRPTNNNKIKVTSQCKNV